MFSLLYVERPYMDICLYVHINKAAVSNSMAECCGPNFWSWHLQSVHVFSEPVCEQQRIHFLILIQSK